MSALVLRLRWRVLCLLLAPVQLLTSAAVRLMRWLARAADEAEIDMLIAVAQQRIRAKQRRAGRP